ncbi:hypothetical protein BDZ91DRAFT_734095 [Kalaharituber pfeilii]|nr:hypothetical protein BDZ91DRAFT_734095 [Kalaharituber pfeilii]
MREGNQRVVEAKKPNGDVVIYLLDMASYEAQDGKREDNLSAQKNQNSGNTMNEPSGVTKELRGFNGAPLPSPKIRPFHPIVHAVPLRREAPKFGTYGFPPVMPESEQGQSRSAEVINLDTLRSIDSRLTKINRTLDGININSPLPSLKVDGGKGERQGEGEEKSGNASGAGKSSSYLYLRSPLHDGKSGTADNVSSSSSVVSRTTTPNQSQGQTQRKKVQFTSEQKKYFVREDGTWDFVLVGDNGKEFLDSAAGSDVATKATTEGDEGEGGQSCKAGVEQAPCIRTPSSSTPSSPLEGKGEQKSGNGH